MGHREDLLEGAKRCLLEKGFVRTTARDIVKESGTNLASIGYHYGSKDALLAQAYLEMIERIGEDFDGPPGEEPSGAPGSLERFQQVWANVIETMDTARPIWLLSLEVVTQADRMPGVREHLAKASIEGRSGLIPMFQGGAEPERDDPVVSSLGGLYQALLNGLMIQWAFDPDTATDAEKLTEGMRLLIEGARKADSGGSAEQTSQA
ncbi:TetR/AcrR family transcriptional regulator [Streptomyces sp. NPDC020719]|uniref:TetR/AcrR family transcriptional regulator n=1 Tax=unclassified Streptomyces TaxID=2593676 RepID=UPI00340866C9